MRSLIFVGALAFAAPALMLGAQTMMRSPIRWDLAAANGEGVTGNRVAPANFPLRSAVNCA